MRLSTKERESILNLYNEGENTKLLASKFSVSGETIRNILKRFGISTKKHKLMGKENEICSLYMEGFNTVEIGKMFSARPTSIWNILLKRGVNIRNASECRKIFNVNHLYFKAIDSNDKAYFLGLLYADGCLAANQWQISISLQEEDGYILQKFKDCIEYEGELKFVRQDHKKSSYKNQTKLCLSDKRIYLDLVNLGCVPKKSQLIRFPFEHIDRKFWREFIRGYFDGDGYVCGSKRRSAGFVGNIEFLTSIQNILFDEGVSTSKFVICHNKEKTCYNLAFRSKKDFVSLYKYLYDENQSDLYLVRKKEKFENVIMDHNLNS